MVGGIFTEIPVHRNRGRKMFPEMRPKFLMTGHQNLEALHQNRSKLGRFLISMKWHPLPQLNSRIEFRPARFGERSDPVPFAENRSPKMTFKS